MKVCLSCDARFEAAAWLCPECGWEPASDPYLRFVDVSDGSFPDESFDLLPDLEARSFWFRARNELILSALRKYFPSAASLLEVGCGTGFVLAALRAGRPTLRLAGGELSRAGLDVAHSRVPDVPLYELDVLRLPFDEEFDVVAGFDVLEHVRDDEQALGEMARSTKPGGGLLVSVPQHPRLWSPVDEYSGHVRRYTRRELTSKLERAGLRVVRATSFVALLLPIVAASRLARRRTAAPYDPRVEYAIPRAVDRLFGAVMGLERRMIEAGVSFPVGSSLLVVAKRDR